MIRVILRFTGPLVSLLLSATVSGCGFTPLYATRGVESGLPAIDVIVPQGRVAYLLRENLDDLIGRDKTKAPLWRLDIQVVQTRDPRGLRLDNVAERYDLGLTVKYSLTWIASGKVARTGEVVSQVSYDAANAPYAGLAARQDSQERAAADAARRIQIQLAGWMAGRTGD